MLVAVDNCAVGSKRHRASGGAAERQGGPEARAVRGLLDAHPLRPGLEQRARLHLRQPAPARPESADRPLHPRADRRVGEGRTGGPGGPIARRALAWGQGRLGFAANRRVLKDGRWVNFGVNPNGPVDHSLPVLRATDAAGKVRAVLFGYACHCTTLGGEFNKICADWAGYACDEIEQQSPGAIALAIIGCGADANPEPRRGLDDAKQHGLAAGREVDRLVKTALTPLPGRIDSQVPQARAAARTASQPRQRSRNGPNSPGPRASSPGPCSSGSTAASRSPRACPTSVQTWCFGDDMAMVFLAGEVVVDYALRLKWEIDPNRLWIAAYSNDVPCYIPSRRILSEGGYEADLSMVFYGHPSRLAPATEDLIIQDRARPSCPRHSMGRGNRKLLVTPVESWPIAASLRIEGGGRCQRSPWEVRHGRRARPARGD